MKIWTVHFKLGLVWLAFCFSPKKKIFWAYLKTQLFEMVSLLIDTFFGL